MHKPRPHPAKMIERPPPMVPPPGSLRAAPPPGVLLLPRPAATSGAAGTRGHNGNGVKPRGEMRLKLAASAFTHSPEGVMILGADGRIIDVNRRFTEITGLTRRHAIGRDIGILRLDGVDADYYTRMWGELSCNGHWSSEINGHRDLGSEYSALLRIRAVTNARRMQQHFIALLSDITGLRRRQDKLEQQAYFDPLTGLPNRALFRDRLNHAIAQTRRRENLMALVYIDLDGFKAINDRHGHSAGDALLVTVAQRMKEALREGDTLCRLGGDEFVAILTDLSGMSEYVPVLGRLLQAASAPVTLGQDQLCVSASIGVTLFPDDPCDGETLLAHADQAMYLAKQSGKNRYQIFDVRPGAEPGTG